MKKLLSILIMMATFLTFALVGCSNDNPTNSASNDETASTSSSENSTSDSGNSSSSSVSNSSSVEVPTEPELLFNESQLCTTFLTGSEITFENLAVKKLNSDKTMTDLTVSDYTLSLDKVDKQVPGKYEVELSQGSLKKSFFINVVEKPEVKDNAVNVKMNASFNGVQGTKNAQGSFEYSDLKCAVEMLSQANFADSVKKVLTFEAGEYVSKINIPAIVKNVSFVGATTGDTTISFGAYSSMKNEFGVDYGTDKSATVTVYGDNFTATNIIFKNSFDFIGNLNNSKIPNKQALAFYINADKAIFEDCSFYGYQDTLEVVAGRHYFKNCLIQGCTDFIFGNNSATLFENCEISSINNGKKFKENSNSGYITATKGNNGENDVQVPNFGLVFLGCRLTTLNDAVTGCPKSSVSLGRPWRKNSTVAWINCEMGDHIGKIAGGKGGKPRYTNMEGGYDANNNKLNNLPKDARFFEYGNSGLGAINDLVYSSFYNYDTKNFEQYTDPDFKFLTATEFAAYTKANIFAKTNGGVTYADEWTEIITE